MNPNPVCDICPHACAPGEGEYGFCRARKNEGGKIVDANYGKLTALALDPIEKKPLRRFYPGSMVLSVGSFGCNLRCPFCQNYAISMAGDSVSWLHYLSPAGLVERAKEVGGKNIGLAYTYNEPVVGFEYVRDTAKLAREAGLKNVLVTNGYINERPLDELLNYIDAMNIDLKAFNNAFYKRIGGDLETVKNAIRVSAERCHVEVTTLVIPGENDSEAEARAEFEWLASIRGDIPLHITRFFARYHLYDVQPTPVGTIHWLVKLAREYLDYVYAGNC